MIYKITPDKNITEFIKTGDLTPLSIHSSSINEDILVGMVNNNGEGKVTRYIKTGKELQNIQNNNQGQNLYSCPRYITENTNGDICTSDCNKRSVVVVNKSGQHRFSYTGHGSSIRPLGICTDVLGHILVCDDISHTVIFLDQQGRFLPVISSLGALENPLCVCVDDKNNLYAGEFRYTHPVTVYKYLE